MNTFLISCFGSSTWGERERERILTMLTPQMRGTYHGVLDLNSSLLVEIWKTQLFDSMAESQPSTASLSKSSNSQDHLFRAWCHPHSSPISCLGFIMTMVIIISFTHKRKTAPNDYAPELLTQIVQSPTKLKDKIELTKND